MATRLDILTDQQQAALQVIAEQTGKSEEELVREAVEQLIDQFDHAHRLALLRQARGMWQDRTDLPDFDAIRREFDRFTE